jgi:hypothetical protein
MWYIEVAIFIIGFYFGFISLMLWEERKND